MAPMVGRLGAASSRGFGEFAKVGGTPPPPTITFSAGVYRTMGTGYALNGRSGWTLGTLTPSSYDDGFAGPFTGVMPGGTSVYIDGISYTQYYVSSNGYLTFGSGSGAIISSPSGPSGFFFDPGDNYWGTNGANGTGNTPSGFAYKFGTTSTGLYFLCANMMGYAYGSPSIDRGWQLNIFWDSANTNQYVEFVYSPALGSISTSVGVRNNTTATNYIATGFVPAANTSYCFSTANKGVTWTAVGAGSWNGVGTF